MKTVSTVKPKDRFVIERANGKCTVLFFDDIKLNKDGLYEFELYRLSAIYRPTLEKTINANFDAWLNQAKQIERPKEKIVEEVKIDSNETIELLCQLLAMEHRMMQMELATSKRNKSNYNKSPYSKIKRIIKSKYMEYDDIIRYMDDFVNNKYMTIDEYSELYDLLDEYYNSL